MTIDIIEDRLKDYQLRTKQQELNAIKEISQEIALAALSRSDFFKIGAFQGGTCLRIIHGLRRFSEDLDFTLIKPSKKFNWKRYLDSIELEFRSFGLEVEVKNRSEADGIIKKAFLKNDSFGRIFQLKHPLLPSDKQVMKIKLEVDTNPPEGSHYETQYLDYPYSFSILTQDRPSLFASKCHAMLCRDYVKGRDWYDFIWYVSKKIQINKQHLENALMQMGPFKNESLTVDKKWLQEHLREKIESIDWKKARQDVETFLPQQDLPSLELWGESYFINLVQKLYSYLDND